MGDSYPDPVDHARTTRQHAGESMKNGANAPGLLAVAIGVVALVVGLFAFATGHAIVGAVALVLAVMVGGGGLIWLVLAHRRVRAAERRWHTSHPAAPAEPPTS